MINKNFLQKEYNYFLNKGKNADNTEIALTYLSYCAYIAYSYPFLDFFCDDELELTLNKISSNNFKEKSFSTQKHKYVFYDAHFIDTAGLTQQYIRFLIDINAEVLVIVNDKNKISKAKNILKEIDEVPNFTLYVAKSKKNTDKVKEVSEEIIKFGASRAFLHFTPWDVVGYLVFKNMPEIERYFINLTDHAFWLGKGCADYFLEFRSFGHNLSCQYRGIKKNKLLFNPYYPISDKIPFEGFDFDTTDKIVGFIGTNLYKLNLDPELKYLHAIKDLLLEHKNFIFVIAGFGNTVPLLSFINDNKLEKKMIFIGKRKDISEVINHIDIYFNSYPFCGALTTQFAVYHEKPIIGLADTSLYSMNALDDLLSVDGYNTPTNISIFKKEASNLITQEKYKIKNINIFKGSVPTRKQFEDNLKYILESKKSKFVYIKNLNHNKNDYLSLYLELENKINKGYFLSKLKFFKHNLRLLSKIDLIKTSCFILLNNYNKIFIHVKNYYNYH